MFIRPAVILWLLAGSSFCSAAIYHWIDSRGRHHYSDHPPADQSPSSEYQPSQPLQTIPAPRLPAAMDSPSATEKSRAVEKRKRKNQQKARERAAAELRRRCEGYEKKLSSIDRKLRRGHSNEQGNRWRRNRRHYQQLRWQQCR